MGPDDLSLLRLERERRLKAEREIERLRGVLRGAKWKIENDSWSTARDIVEHGLKKSMAYYPYPIEGEPADPSEVKR